MVEGVDWSAWHAGYENPASPLAQRLRIIQAQIRACLDAHPDRSLGVLSLCAGDGRDLLDVLACRADADRVRATLVELDPRNVERARDRLRVGSAATITIREADASRTDSFLDATPADLVLACGIFGNVSDADVRSTIAAGPGLCVEGGWLIWTRSRRAPDLTPSIRRWFDEAGFTELAFQAPAGTLVAVGAHRFEGEPAPLEPGRRLFSFVR
jgi:Putative methyltransferase